MRCENPGCFEAGYECVLPDEVTAYTYCAEHAFENGFCKCCGLFFAGIESFDFGKGYCHHCTDQLAQDYPLEGEPEDDYDPESWEEHSVEAIQ